MLESTNRNVVIRAVIAFLTANLAVIAASGQKKPGGNPLTGNPTAIKEGHSLFRINCSPCHGLDARGGGRGPDLTLNRWVHGSSDEEIFRTISQGVPGTEMPASDTEESETWAIVAYLRSQSPPKKLGASGDRLKGEKTFRGSGGCSACHMVKGQGGVLGPDLSRVGASRSASYLVDSIRDPNKELSSGMMDPSNQYGPPLVYDKVTVTTAGGEEFVGIAMNEDTFSIQLLGTDQKLHLFLKKELKQVLHEQKSLMPAYSEQRMSNAELQDLIAYLQSLTGN